MTVEDIGPKTARAIQEWFQNKKNKELLKDLKEAGVRIVYSRSKAKKKLSNKTFVFTGSLENLTREEAKKKVLELGGKSASNISQKTDYLIAGSQPGSKLKEAKKLGIKIISEDNFLKIIKK
jgi:DNA ligase (NAD+)